MSLRLPNYQNYIYDQKGTPEEKKFKCGGTGFYANEVSVMEYRRKREQDMNQLEHDEFLNTLRNFHGGKEYGISMSRQMPYYHLYDQFINQQVKKGFKREKFKDYQKYSIGFLTRGRRARDRIQLPGSGSSARCSPRSSSARYRMQWVTIKACNMVAFVAVLGCEAVSDAMLQQCVFDIVLGGSE